jgi:hypothetical protein
VSSYAIKDWSPKDFFELLTWSGERWSARFPAVRLVTCKWRPEDLIPGLSDVDARVVCDDIRPEEWIRLDEIVGQAQLEVMTSHPEWARKLEHTPGIGCTRSELLDPALFQPETRTWDYYWGDRELYNQLRDMIDHRPFDSLDEYYLLASRFVPWCTPYNREIDPPINIPHHILPKYALHSRVMHYFVPCLMSALTVINRATLTGKRESLYRWSQLYPKEPVLREAMYLLEVNYEVLWLEDEHEWYALEERLWEFIQKIIPEVLRAVTIVDLGSNPSLADLKQKLRAFPGQPMMSLFNSLRFSRIRKSRWLCYLNAPPGFETEHAAFWEVKWLAGPFTTAIFNAYARLKWGQKDLPLDEMLSRMVPALLDQRDAAVIRQVFATAAGTPTPAEALERLRPTAAVMSDYYLILQRMFDDIRAGSAAARPAQAVQEASR